MTRKSEIVAAIAAIDEDIQRYEAEDEELAKTLDERHPSRLQLARRIHAANSLRKWREKQLKELNR